MALKSWTSGEIATAYNPICNDAKAIITTGLKMEYELLPMEYELLPEGT